MEMIVRARQLGYSIGEVGLIELACILLWQFPLFSQIRIIASNFPQIHIGNLTSYSCSAVQMTPLVGF